MVYKIYTEQRFIKRGWFLVFLSIDNKNAIFPEKFASSKVNLIKALYYVGKKDADGYVVNRETQMDL